MLHLRYSRFLLQIFFILFFTCSSIPEVKTDGAAAVQAAVADLSRLSSGMGVITRIRNNSVYSADIGFDKIVHDQIPNNTTGYVKRVDGSYLTCRKIDGAPVVAFEKVDSKDPITLWQFNRIKDEVLHDWIGLSHVNSDGKYLGVDAEEGKLGFISKDLRSDSKAVQWEIVGSNITGFLFRNRLTGGILHQLTQEIEVLKAGQQDREETATAQDGVIVGLGDTLLTNTPSYDFALLDARGAYLNYTPANWLPATRTGDAGLQSTMIRTVKSWDGNFRGSIANGMRVHFFSPVFSKLLVTWSDGRTLSSPNWGDWERFDIFNRGWASGLPTIALGNLVGIRTWHNQWLRIHDDKTQYTQNPQEDPAVSYFHIMPFGLLNINDRSNVWRLNPKNRNQAQLLPRGFLERVAMRNADEIYGISHRKGLFRWQGNQWNPVATSFEPRLVSVSAAGDLCCVDLDNKLWLRQGEGWSLFANDIKCASIRSRAEIWTIMKDGNIMRNTGTTTDNFSLPVGAAIWVSVSDSGAVWAIAADNTIWRLNVATKAWLQIPGRGYSISARSETDAYVVGMDAGIYRFEGGAWVKAPYNGSDVSLASGISVTKIRGEREKKVSTFLTTFDADKKTFGGNPESQLSIEIEKLGMGGGIPPNDSKDFAGIPASQRPRVSGFAVDRIADFDPAAILNVNPLISKGAAWLELGLRKAGVGGVSFMTRVQEAGDAQIIFGQEMSNSFAYKVIFGGWGNKKSAIVRREYVKGDPVDTVVYELSVDQYPIAHIQGGAFLPYWVSIENGFIMAGMGDFGANVFMAWRDPNPIPNIRYIGFGSHKTPVQYNNIKVTPPAIFSTVPRVYAESRLKIDPAKGGEATWAEYPFRMNDRGCVQVSIQGQEGAAIILARKQNTKASHYAIVFGDDKNSAITIKKWHTGQKRYNERARIKLDPLPALKLDPKKRKSYWVSFYFGQIVIGTGDIGTNPIYIFQDLAAIDGIDSIGFANQGNGSVSFSTLQVGSPLVLRAEKQLTSYDKTGGPTPFGGGVTIILPFDYEFSQEDQVVKLTDYVLNNSFYLGATPQQGAIYAFQVTIQANGAPTLDWTKAPENQKQLEIQKAVMKVKNEAELANLEAARMRAQAEIDKTMKIAEGDKQRGLANALSTGGQAIVTAGSTLAGAGASAGPLGMIVAAVGIGIAAGGVGMIAASTAISAKAADKDFEGAELKAVKDRQAADMEANASKAKALAEGAADMATVGLRSNDSYVFLDTPGKRPEMGSQETSEAAKRNRTDAAAKLEQAANIRPTTLDDMIKLSLLYKDFVMLANQSAVLSGDPTIKERFLGGADRLLTAYLDAVSSSGEIGLQLHQDMLIFLLNAYNNPYLLDELNPKESQTKESWYWLVTIFGRQLVAATDQRSIALDHFYGEYFWLEDADDGGFKFTTPGTGIVSFEARGTDILVCLSDAKKRVRNSEEEVYEICFGGWDNTKTALRLRSLDKYVAVVTKKDNPKAMTDPAAFKKYWVSCNNGVINIGCGAPGQGTVLTWKDPYPNTSVQVVGLSSWNSRVEYRNITVADEIPDITEAEGAAATVDESATLAQNLDKLQQIEDVFNASEAAEKNKTGTKLTPEELDKLEILGVDTASAAFNQRDDGTLEDKKRLKDLIDQLYEDASDDDHINLFAAMSDALDTEIQAAATKSEEKPAEKAATTDKEAATAAPAKEANTTSAVTTKDTAPVTEEKSKLPTPRTPAIAPDQQVVPAAAAAAA